MSNTQRTHPGTPSGEGGDLDAVGDELRESELTRKVRTATGSKLDACGEKLELTRIVSTDSDYAESDIDYRTRLLDKSERDTPPARVTEDELATLCRISKASIARLDNPRTVDSFGGRIVLSDSQGVIGEVIADEGDALLDLAEVTVAVLDGSLPWHASPPEYGRNDNPAHVPPNVECITVDQLHTVILQTALHDKYGDSPERSEHVIAWNDALSALAEAARPHFVKRPDPQSPSGWDLPDAARLRKLTRDNDELLTLLHVKESDDAYRERVSKYFVNPRSSLAAPSAGQPPTLPDDRLDSKTRADIDDWHAQQRDWLAKRSAAGCSEPDCVNGYVHADGEVSTCWACRVETVGDVLAGLDATLAGQPVESLLPDGPLFDAEDVTRLLGAFAGMSEEKARTVVNLYALPNLAEAAREAGEKSAQVSYGHASIAYDHSVAEEQYRTQLAQEVQVAQDEHPDVLETFSRLVGES